MKKRSLPRYLRFPIQILIVAALVVGVIRWITSEEQVVYSGSVTADQLLQFQPAGDKIPYAILMQGVSEQERSGGNGNEIRINPSQYDTAAPITKLSSSKDDGKTVLNWDNEAGSVDWTFHVAKAGWYELHLDYKPLPGSNSSVIRGVMIDGSYPFEEAERVELERMWKDAKYPYDRNELGMQVRPQQTELNEWISKAVSDYSVSSRPLLFRLETGEHTLRLVGERGGVALQQMSFQSHEHVIPYEEYKSAYPSVSSDASDWYMVRETEQFERKSHLSIQTDHWAEPYISPDPKGRITYNVLGGNHWNLPGEWVEWDIEVPTNGWYEIDLKNFQNYRPGFKAYRTISIDGKVPFEEMLNYAIDYHKEFEITTLSNVSGEPFKFYLKQGKHSIRMTADSTKMQPILIALKDTLLQIAAFDREMRLITGNYSKSASDSNIDSTRTWEMKKYDPEVENKLQAITDRLNMIRLYTNSVNERDSDLSQAIKASVTILEEMLSDVNEIPSKIKEFSTIQANIGTWMSTLTKQPLLLDYLVVRTPDAKTGLKEPTALSRIPYSLADFSRSFYVDYDLGGPEEEGALTIWVGRGRDYVDLLRELVSQDFTPKTGIEVNINLMPNPNMLILGNAAGEVPDIALGVGESIPADYAMRNAVEDLSQYPGFDDMMNQFIPGVTRALMYDGGTYGLPEVQNFQLLFYRSDILERLDLEVPDTWDDVFDILPTLQENGMTMNVPKADYSTLFLEHGTDPYTQDGLKSNIFSDTGQQAFKLWTEMFTKYNLPIDIPAFFQHFRDGDIPIGISDFNTYVQLQVAAPEITGHWKVAPLPGIKQENGEVVRWSPQGLTGAMIMKKSEQKDKAWEFLKWWTSGEIQSRYAADMESFYGIEYRWNTANVKAMDSLNWPADDLKAIREQASWALNMPNVPGYYFLGREMDFAWNRTVFDGIPADESLEEAHLSLQREMDRRQRNFGIMGRSLNIPQITEPYVWEDTES
ncbi:extracellular solute-binding protein [Paenibacillus taichungensis]|uniref:extracellular solute-binding protein n=1 Tax=Paenibacillus taichungensis TaxID=484184 RepID=UPI002DBECA3C|nr:extracellular solute-binding protein [Paenibacillus taichungensis]MEC0110085.1 extracellular solute-binding protein [Paenibacillus taichungensis]MEC0199089.1 extracellular solute-binding protein [Paenibacillus taichungensis]